MKKIDNNSDTDEDLDKSGRKEQGKDVKDQIVPLTDTKSFEKCDDFQEVERKENKDKSETISEESCQDVPENIEQANLSCELDVISSPESYNSVRSPQCFNPIGVTDSYCVTNNQENYVNCNVRNYDEEPYDPEDSLQSYETDYLPDNYVTEDSSSLPVSESVFIQKEENEGLSSLDPLPSPEERREEVAGQEEEEKAEEPVTRVYSPIGNDESENEAMSSSMSYLANVKESETEEVEEMRCSSRGGSVLVMSSDACPDDCELAKPNTCTNEEVTYRDHLNSIERVDGIVFHTRNTVIDSSSTSATGYPCETTVMKYREEQLMCDKPEKDSEVIGHYSDLYSNEYVECLLPKRVCNSVQIPVLGQKPSEADMYMYNTSVQNMVICRNSSDCEKDAHPVNVNGLHSYSFHRVSPECCSNMNNVEQSFNDPSSNLCSFVQNSNYEERGIKIVRKIPSDEDFMRRIEKTLFESKIESRDGEFMESKYKAELDLSLPFKKRLRTLYSEKFISPKVDSFPSYCAKPMINIAELEGLLPQTTKSYQENYK